MNGEMKSMPSPRRNPVKSGTMRKFNPSILSIMHFTKGGEMLECPYFDAQVFRSRYNVLAIRGISNRCNWTCMPLERTCYTLSSDCIPDPDGHVL